MRYITPLLTCVVLLASLLTGQVCSQTLTYDNKHIDPLCFEKNDGRISLKSCGIKFDPNLEIIQDKNMSLTNELIGYSFKIKNAGPTQGYSYYKSIADFKNKSIILTINKNGGTGDFTAIKSVTREGNEIIIKTLQAGDRCNGGISQVIKNKYDLTYNVKITPFDILRLTHDNPHHLKAYDDLVSCAVCCAGVVHVSRVLNQDFEREKIKSIDLTNYSLDGYGNDKPYQTCFNSLVKRYKLKNKLIFTLDELKTFTNEFNQKCFDKTSILSSYV